MKLLSHFDLILQSELQKAYLFLSVLLRNWKKRNKEETEKSNPSSVLTAERL